MEMERMLVTKALNELNLLNSRIQKEIQNTGFVTAAKVIEKKVNPSVTKEEYSDSAAAGYQSIIDLISRRQRIKAAIVHSNAGTPVEIGGVTMTVAEAIERKTSIEYEEFLLRTMKNQYERAQSTMNTNNVLMEEKIDKNIEVLLGKEGKAKNEDLTSMMNTFREANQWGLVDPLDIATKIKELETNLMTFKSEVDSVLQVSNCITWIEF